MENFWRKCSICKNPIAFGSRYQKCSVSTCRKNVYCSVTCWDVHVPVMNHKSAWAEENEAPMSDESENPRSPRRILVTDKKPTTNSSHSISEDIPQDILIVASKFKAYVKAKHGINTSGNVFGALSDIVRAEADKAAEKAKADGRKTLMDRDF